MIWDKEQLKNKLTVIQKENLVHLSVRDGCILLSQVFSVRVMCFMFSFNAVIFLL